jgi:hypothetical protein
MCQKNCNVFKQFYALILTSAEMKSPKVLRVYRTLPKEAQITKIISEDVVGKLTSSHLYGNNTQVHTVPIHIPISMLLS